MCQTILSARYIFDLYCSLFTLYTSYSLSRRRICKNPCQWYNDARIVPCVFWITIFNHGLIYNKKLLFSKIHLYYDLNERKFPFMSIKLNFRIHYAPKIQLDSKEKKIPKLSACYRNGNNIQSMWIFYHFSAWFLSVSVLSLLTCTLKFLLCLNHSSSVCINALQCFNP